MQRIRNNINSGMSKYEAQIRVDMKIAFVYFQFKAVIDSYLRISIKGSPFVLNKIASGPKSIIIFSF